MSADAHRSSWFNVFLSAADHPCPSVRSVSRVCNNVLIVDTEYPHVFGMK